MFFTKGHVIFLQKKHVKTVCFLIDNKSFGCYNIRAYVVTYELLYAVNAESPYKMPKRVRYSIAVGRRKGTYPSRGVLIGYE